MRRRRGSVDAPFRRTVFQSARCTPEYFFASMGLNGFTKAQVYRSRTRDGPMQLVGLACGLSRPATAADPCVGMTKSLATTYQCCVCLCKRCTVPKQGHFLFSKKKTVNELMRNFCQTIEHSHMPMLAFRQAFDVPQGSAVLSRINRSSRFLLT